MADILADEHVPKGLVDNLRLLGHDVRTVRDMCESKYGDGISDATVLEEACRLRRIVLTFNQAHFRTLHKQCPWHHGIVLTNDRPDDRKALARRLDEHVKGAGCLRGTLLNVTATPPAKRRGIKQQ